MLCFMTVILCSITFIPFPLQGTITNLTAEKIIDFRRGIFSAVLTAFAAWIGAGAAYFFGRENFKEAMMAIKPPIPPTPKAILEKNTLGEVMRSLEPTVVVNDTIDTVRKKCLDDPAKWIVTVLDEKGRLKTVFHEESIQIFINDKIKEADESAKKVYADLLKTPIIDVVDYIRDKYKGTEKLTTLIDIHVELGPEEKCLTALSRMDVEGKYLTFILDSNGIPMGYLTTNDLRKLGFQF